MRDATKQPIQHTFEKLTKQMNSPGVNDLMELYSRLNQKIHSYSRTQTSTLRASNRVEVFSKIG